MSTIPPPNVLGFSVKTSKFDSDNYGWKYEENAIGFHKTWYPGKYSSGYYKNGKYIPFSPPQHVGRHAVGRTYPPKGGHWAREHSVTERKQREREEKNRLKEEKRRLRKEEKRRLREKRKGNIIVPTRDQVDWVAAARSLGVDEPEMPGMVGSQEWLEAELGDYAWCWNCGNSFTMDFVQEHSGFAVSCSYCGARGPCEKSPEDSLMAFAIFVKMIRNNDDPEDDLSEEPEDTE